MEAEAKFREQHADPIPISALQHAVYCMRQAALIHIERLWEENRFTAEGRVLHAVAHEAGERKGRRGVRRVRIENLRLGRVASLAEIADSESLGGRHVHLDVTSTCGLRSHSWRRASLR